MRENRIGLGHVLSGVGALIALISLWLPWFKLDLSKVREEPAFKAAVDAGGLDQQVQAEINRFVALLPKSISGNGWDVMQRTDIAFALGAAVVLALLFATISLGADSRGTARIMTGIGIGGMVLILFKLSNSGIPDSASDFVTRGPGFMVCLIGWTICAAGGIWVVWNPPAEQVDAAPVTPAPYVPRTAAPIVASEPVAQPVPELVPPAPLTPEYKPDPSRVSSSVAPPPR